MTQRRYDDNQLIGEKEVMGLRNSSVNEKTTVTLPMIFYLVSGLVSGLAIVFGFAFTVKASGDQNAAKIVSAEARIAAIEVNNNSNNTAIAVMGGNVVDMKESMKRFEANLQKLSDRFGVKP